MVGVAVSVVTVPESGSVVVGLDTVHGADKVQFRVLVGLMLRQYTDQGMMSMVVNSQPTTRRVCWDRELESSQEEGLCHCWQSPS